MVSTLLHQQRNRTKKKMYDWAKNISEDPNDVNLRRQLDQCPFYLTKIKE